MPLAAYRKKRDFSKTPEPRGRRSAAGGRLFTVQQHHASHPHFDLRLELGGVLKSWAVPKGPSMDPAVKRLAVEVEDHPVDYAEFEGHIPKGQYGGGTVLLWDKGIWREQEGDAAAALKRGSLKFTLEGEKLRGAWALVRMKPRDGKNQWLLIKERDGHAKAKSDIVGARPKSVSSGKTIGELEAEESQERPRPAPRAADVGRRGGKNSSDSPPAGAVERAQPKSLRPELATLVDEVPVGDGWLHEIKFDGYRVLAFIRDAKATLVTRAGLDWTRKFGDLHRELEGGEIRDAVLDGELVAMNSRGLSDFQSLQQAISDGSAGSLRYYVFDLPYWEGHDLTACTLRHRQELLRGLLRRIGSKRVLMSEHITGRGERVHEEACRLGLEGVVSKRLDSPYVPGRGRDWVKSRCGSRQEMVIGGFTQPKGHRQGIGALLLGHFEGDRLVYAGKVGTGFDDAELRRLAGKLKALKRDEPAFDPPPRGAAVRGATWVKPELIAEIGFTQWTRDGRLRHPVYIGLRADKPASAVVRERPAEMENAVKAKGKTAQGPAQVAGVTITHPDRVVYPDVGLTKRDVAAYYAAVAERMQPFLTDRPLSLVRCPGGVGGACFFHKHFETAGAAGLREVKIRESKGLGSYVIVEGPAGLAHLAQMNVLEVHLWGSRADLIEKPDILVFDLDPGPGVDWGQLVDGAVRVRKALQDQGLESFVKTTGGKGIHVVAPVNRSREWDSVKRFAHDLASDLAAADPAAFTDIMTKSKRPNRVFIDYLRNQRGATSAAPFTLRARPGATVSVPLAWKQLGSIRPGEFTAATVASLKGDPWREFWKVRQSLPASYRRPRT